jgi:hypothetical protein
MIVVLFPEHIHAPGSGCLFGEVGLKIKIRRKENNCHVRYGELITPQTGLVLVNDNYLLFKRYLRSDPSDIFVLLSNLIS